MNYFWNNSRLQPNAAGPSERALERDLGLTRAEARQLKAAISSAHGGRSVDAALDLADTLMRASGVEAIRGDYHVDRYYFDIVALYVNTGDTYNTTLLYETEPGRFRITTFGDWVERNTRRYNIE